jgi:hypothetical protein
MHFHQLFLIDSFHAPFVLYVSEGAILRKVNKTSERDRDRKGKGRESYTTDASHPTGAGRSPNTLEKVHMYTRAQVQEGHEAYQIDQHEQEFVLDVLRSARS